MRNLTLLSIALFLLPACSFVDGRIATEPPPLADMEEPLALHREADDEVLRIALPAGGFTGAYVADARQSLEEMEADPEGLLVSRVVENSPADAAGLRDGDLILEANGKAVAWASEWLALELAAQPGAVLRVRYDRAGALGTADITVVARVRPTTRKEAERYREEDRVGVVMRTATEVESRAADLGPGGGAVIVGLSLGSPWRAAGLRFGDLIVKVGDASVSHPNVLLKAIRDAAEDATMPLTFRRDGKVSTLEVGVSQRRTELSRVRIPVLLDIERDRGTKTVSVLLGLYKRTTTRAAWDIRFLWLFKFQGGDADLLEEVSK